MSFGGGLESLPWQTRSVKVHEYVSHRLHVVSSGLFDAQMRVDRSVARRAGQVLILSVRYVLTGAHVAILFRQAKVDQEQFVAMAPDSHQKIVGLKTKFWKF